MVDRALNALDRGWLPIPLCWPTAEGACGCGRGHASRAIGKAPLLGTGYQRLRPTEADIRVWWRRWRCANVGLLLEPANLLVVDADGAAGLAEIQRLGVGDTYTVRRSPDRRHFYFACDDAPRTRRIHRGESRQIDVLSLGYIPGHKDFHEPTGRNWDICPGQAL